MGFLNEPRRVWWRKALFQVHLWLGIALGLYYVLVGLTGSIIVYKKEMERAMIPALVRVEPGSQRGSLTAMIDKVKSAYPQASLSNIYTYWEPGDTWSFRMQSKTEGRIQVYVDPYRLEVVGEDRYRDKFLQWVYDLHVNLLMGNWGEWLNGWGGVTLTVVSLSGLVVWWPGRRWWRQGFRYETRARWKRQNYDLHKLAGFYSAILLVVVALTGAYFPFADEYHRFIAWVTQGPSQLNAPRVKPLEGQPNVPLDQVLAVAVAAIPGGVPTLFRPAAKPGEVHTLHHRLPGDWRTQGDNAVYIHPQTAEIVRITYHRDLPFGVRLQRDMFGLHFGTFAGHYSRVLWVLLGIVPALLFVTGLLMWWNRSLSKFWRRRNQTSAATGPSQRAA